MFGKWEIGSFNEITTVIEYIQPKKCCIHPHEWCNPSVEYFAHQQLSKEKTEFWKQKLEELVKLVN